jgi:LAO/AO transport system kinase
MTRADHDELLDRFQRRDRRALAEILSLVEGGHPPLLPPVRASGHVVGITGAAGAGKSTLVAASIDYLRQQGRTVAVLACDPTSRVSGGALLGDRVRTRLDPADEGVFFRSLATRGAPGGISAAVGPACDWLLAFGYDVVLVETVGVGQDQVAVRDVVRTLVLVVTPHSGDRVQWEKAGLLEVADIVAVNKADLAGADAVRRQLVEALSLAPSSRQGSILLVSAAKGQGIDELWRAIESRGA